MTTMLKCSRGNKKIGKDTLIFNLEPATTCTAKKLGLCQLDNPARCYAMIPERMFPNVRPYRENQQQAFEKQSIQKIAEDIQSQVKKNTRYIRFSESGDIKSQKT